MRSRTTQFLLYGALTGYFLMAVSFSLMPIEQLGHVPGFLFWAGLCAGVLCMVLLERCRRKFYAAFAVDRKAVQLPRAGVFNICTSGLAKTGDIILLAAIVAAAAAWLATGGTGMICYILLSAVAFFFSVHCILNGRNYSFVIHQQTLRQALEKKKSNVQ